MTLEDKLMDDVRNGKQIDIERALLIASGCETEEKVYEYKTKLNEIEKQFHGYASARNVQGEVETAKALHEFLWLGKIEEDYVRECSNLVDMIEVIMHSQTMGEGDCVGLSSLLGALGARQGLEFTVLYNTIHVLSRLRVGEKVIDIEIDPYYTLSYANRSMPKSALGDIEGCKEDVRIYRQLLRNAA